MVNLMLSEEEAVLFDAAHASGCWADLVTDLRVAWLPLLAQDPRVAPVLKERRRHGLRLVAS
jgi:hypothetical protein